MPSLNHCDLPRHVGVNNLPKVVTQQRRSWELNYQPASCKSNALATRLPSRQLLCSSVVEVYSKHHRRPVQYSTIMHSPQSVSAFSECLFCRLMVTVVCLRNFVGLSTWLKLLGHKYAYTLCLRKKLPPLNSL